MSRRIRRGMSLQIEVVGVMWELWSIVVDAGVTHVIILNCFCIFGVFRNGSTPTVVFVSHAVLDFSGHVDLVAITVRTKR
jgi:hypothetical protein